MAVAAARVACLLPSATEVMGALGLRDCVVAVTHECDLCVARVARDLRPSSCHFCCCPAPTSPSNPRAAWCRFLDLAAGSPGN